MTRKPIGLSVPYREITPEDEAFNEIERRSKVKQTLIAESKPKWVGLTDREKSNLWLESRAAIPRFHTYATLIEAKLKEKNT